MNELLLSPRIISFRYDLLDRFDRKIKTLDTVETATVSCVSNAQIKRIAKFFIKDDPTINYASDRIQPLVIFKTSEGYVEFSQGIFLLSSALRTERNGNIYRYIDGYDGNQVLVDDKFENRYTIASGTNYITAVKTIITSAGITKVNIEGSGKTLSATKEWEPGTTKLTVINALLSEINFVPLYVDENGFYVSRQYVSPSQQAPKHTYEDGELGVLYNGLVETIDTFGVANKFVAFTSNPDATSLRSSYTNTNPNSPLSTVSRGRTIVDIRQVDDIADQVTLDDYVQRIAFEASQVYGYITAETAIMPTHGINDVAQINYSPLGISGKFTETEWTMQLKAGAKMRHTFRRLVTI